MYIYCSICYESKCSHITVTEGEVVNKRGDTSYHIKCHGYIETQEKDKDCKCCRYGFSVTSADVMYNHKIKYGCSSCKNCIILSAGYLSFEQIHRFTGNKHYPKGKCLSCKETKLIEIKNFKTCITCKGTGLKNCELCNDLGFYLVKDSDGWIRSECLCKKGFAEHCHDCEGKKVIFDKEFSMKCKECTD